MSSFQQYCIHAPLNSVLFNASKHNMSKYFSVVLYCSKPPLITHLLLTSYDEINNLHLLNLNPRFGKTRHEITLKVSPTVSLVERQ